MFRFYENLFLVCCVIYDLIKTWILDLSSGQVNLSIANFLERECSEKACPVAKCPQTEGPDLKCPEITCPVPECPENICPVLECPESSCPECECSDQIDQNNEELIQKNCDQNDNLAEHDFVEETNPIDFKEWDEWF